MTDKPFVSIVIPTHNRPELLEKLLFGLSKQNYAFSRFEVIIVPSPRDLFFEHSISKQSFPFRLSVIDPSDDYYQGKNVSYKRNKGIHVAQGTWIGLIDDDCIPSHEWIEKASIYFDRPNTAGVEGKTLLPEGAPNTLTMKGLKRLALPHSYQTCNIFFKKEELDKCGGLDQINFPWFLEDTDLAWSILDTGNDIVFCEHAIVYHPVTKSAPWRLIHEAKHAGLKVILYKKHPRQYLKYKMKIFRISHFVYLTCLLTILVCLILGQFSLLWITLSVNALILVTHMFKLFWNIKTSWQEIWQVGWRTSVAPFFMVTSYVAHSIKQKISLRDFFKLMNPIK